MRRNCILGRVFIVGGAWFLLSGIFRNDMGGIMRLGYNPDVPMSFGFAPGRYILGILLYGGILIAGIRMVWLAGRDDED